MKDNPRKELNYFTNYFTISELFPNCSMSEIYHALNCKSISTNLLYSWRNLNWLRYHYKKPIVINSGYRESDHNIRVGGVKTSQHLQGLAFDLKRTEGLTQTIIDLAVEKPYKFGQVIFYDNFVHVTFSNSKYSKFTPMFNDKTLIPYYENKKQQMASRS